MLNTYTKIAQFAHVIEQAWVGHLQFQLSTQKYANVLCYLDKHIFVAVVRRDYQWNVP